MLGPAVQRLRLAFSRGEEVKYLGHLDLTRLWVRALRRARLPLYYSHGYSPHPRLSFAAPLAVGITSQAELLDVYLSRRVSTLYFLQAVVPQLPSGVDVLRVEEVALSAPALQALVSFAEYQVTLETLGLKSIIPDDPSRTSERITALLSCATLPRERLRDGQLRAYDLRPLVADLWLEKWAPGRVTLGMRLVTGSQAAGRPEEVLAALGWADVTASFHRTRLVLG